MTHPFHRRSVYFALIVKQLQTELCDLHVCWWSIKRYLRWSRTHTVVDDKHLRSPECSFYIWMQQKYMDSLIRIEEQLIIFRLQLHASCWNNNNNNNNRYFHCSRLQTVADEKLWKCPWCSFYTWIHKTVTFSYYCSCDQCIWVKLHQNCQYGHRLTLNVSEHRPLLVISFEGAIQYIGVSISVCKVTAVQWKKIWF